MKSSPQKILLSASIICANLLELKNDLRQLEKSGIDHIHFDVMDGTFVQRLGLLPEVLIGIKKVVKVPVDVHLMIENPDSFIPAFINAGADIITVHAESTRHLGRSIRLIKSLGARAGVALNPATPLSVLDYVLDDIDLVMIMAINPGIVGHKLIPAAIEKITHLKSNLANHPNILIEVDGGVTIESAPSMVRAGATMLVCGSATIFKANRPISSGIKKLRTILKSR